MAFGNRPKKAERRRYYGKAITSGCLREGEMPTTDEFLDTFTIASLGSMVMGAVM
jgi:preprotein translocase subunit Sss1